MHLKRKPLFYVLNIILPCVMLSILQLMVFLVPPSAGEKVSLGVTVLLSFTVFLLMVSDNMPQTSLYIPLLGKNKHFTYSSYLSCCFFTRVSLLIVADIEVAPYDLKFSQFHAVFWKFWQNRMLAPLPWSVGATSYREPWIHPCLRFTEGHEKSPSWWQWLTSFSFICLHMLIFVGHCRQ